ncbi:MAG: polysaccharide deacetylase family protein [Gemmatimonadetes bacterium]|nr:polysaccharide deacetylase family protein [Gemmatimonadota bacterium]
MRPAAEGPRTVCFSVDVEPDCPPYLAGWRGVEEGLPALLGLLADAEVTATFFTTGETAERHPAAVASIVAAGHELGCHGHTHRRFDGMDPADARDEVERSSATLRAFAPVTSFRAPNLSLPDACLPLLEDAGYRLDSSEGAYKPARWAGAAARALGLRPRPETTLRRVAASTTSSALRLPPALRDPILLALASPVVLFVHPWEMVDLSGERLRWDCRARTGEPARAAVAEVLRLFQEHGARFLRMDALPDAPARHGAGGGPAAGRGAAT